MTTYPQYKPDENMSDYDRMAGLIEFLSSYIEQYHGGSVKLLEYDGRTLKVEMGGACVGCPLSPHTLRGWIEGTVRQFFPEIEEVVAHEVAGG
jgi:Fe-S cluster biogenesis protein NfuA